MLNPIDEADWNFLLDDDRLKTSRNEAENRFRDLGDSQVKYIRKRAKNDLFFLASGLLEYDLMTEGFHGHYCQWLAKNRGRRRRMTLMARGHYKTTVNTISDSVQMALPNDAGVISHPYCLGPDVSILLGHENKESASRFLYEIARSFLSKPAMLAFFSECIPTRGVQRINKWELELPHQGYSREPTFDTIGVGGAEQGRHYNWLKLDDVVGVEARDSKTVMETTNRWFSNVTVSLLRRRRIDGWDLTGTHYSAQDTYTQATRTYGVDKINSFIRNYFKKDILRFPPGDMIVYGRAIEENGVIAFPEEITPEDIIILKKNPRDYAAQHANNPKDSSLTEFDPAWIKFYNYGNAGRIYVFAGDKSWSVDKRDLDICIFIDPSVGESDVGDETGIIVTGCDKQFNIYVLEAKKERLKAPLLIDEMFRLYTKWWPRLISIENVAFSGMLKYWFEQKCNDLRVYPSIYDYKPGSKRSKEARIKGLTSYFAAGQVYMLEGMTQLRDELEWFPLGDSEHILDAFAQGPEVWSKGMDQESVNEWKEAEDMVIGYRDALTGY